MRKSLIISLLAVHLLGNTELFQLIRLPMLIVHYQHHLRDNAPLCLIDFIGLHYGKGDGRTSDNNEERQLPFMRVNLSSFSIAIIPYSITSLPLAINKSIPFRFADFIDNYIPEYYTISLLRPPILFS